MKAEPGARRTTSARVPIRALVVAGDGLNCEKETAAACADAGFRASILHLNDMLLEGERALQGVSLVVIPGGFSFGDELGSGKILALKLGHGLKGVIERFVRSGGALLGICNGFQALANLGVFNELGCDVVLTQNRGGRFIDRWVGLELTGASIFTDRLRAAGVTRLELPIRHGEGRLVFTEERAAAEAFEAGRCVLRYEDDVNGSWNRVAALSAFEGRVMGLMPHPEAFWSGELHPWGSGRGAEGGQIPLGVAMFRSAYDYFREGKREGGKERR
ncbi:MAG: phosphoribosylformylglycinamidine synthase subunit PurQ [Deltaproteobacteria bacterium]|nr:phosphoribosylformylglycinamidine synthase subunit PurQ [Deltaproteobacteria bacterium]